MNTLKVFIISLLILSLVSCQNHSGLKFGFDTSLFNLLEKVDLNRFLANKTIASNLHFERTSFPSYGIEVHSVNITDVKSPSSVNVEQKRDNEIDYLKITLKDLSLSLSSSFNIKVIGLFNEQAVSTPIFIQIQKIEGDFYFNQGEVKFLDFSVEVSNIEMKFENIFFNTIYKIAKSLIINVINTQTSKIHLKVETALNSFISSQMLIDVGMGIGINATNIDRPKLELVNKKQKKVVKLFSSNSLGEAMPSFLGEEIFTAASNEMQSTILEFGIHASLYPNLSPDVKPNIEPAVDMSYVEKTFENDITLLLSDYTLNSLFFMIAQTGAVKQVFTNETNTMLPYNIDTEGLSVLVPELSKTYPDNKKVELKFYINALDHVQPLIETGADGSTVTINFGVDLNVFNSTDPWDDPDKALRLNVTTHFKVQYLVSSSKLSLILMRTVVDCVEKKLDNISADENILKSNLDNMMNEVLKLYKPKLTNIDVFGLLEKSFSVKMSNMIILTEEKYLVLSANLDQF